MSYRNSIQERDCCSGCEYCAMLKIFLGKESIMKQIREELPMWNDLFENNSFSENRCCSGDYTEVAIRYIQDNLTTVTVDSVAKYVGINRSYLTKLFSEKTGLSPMSYIIKKRMERASYYLENTNWMVRKVASEVGYKDPLHFSKMFKNYYGIGPKDYRKGVEPHDHFKAS